jgi:hypothetical protein
MSKYENRVNNRIETASRSGFIIEVASNQLAGKELRLKICIIIVYNCIQYVSILIIGIALLVSFDIKITQENKFLK